MRGLHIPADLRRRAARRVLTNGDQIMGVVLLALIAVAALSAARMELGSLMQPGPGLWLLSVSVIGAVLALLLVLVGRETPTLADEGTFRNFAVTFVSVPLFVAVYSLAGFLLASSITLFVLLNVVGRYRAWKSALIAVVGSCAVYAIFSLGLSLPLRAI